MSGVAVNSALCAIRGRAADALKKAMEASADAVRAVDGAGGDAAAVRELRGRAALRIEDVVQHLNGFENASKLRGGDDAMRLLDSEAYKGMRELWQATVQEPFTIGALALRGRTDVPPNGHSWVLRSIDDLAKGVDQLGAKFDPQTAWITGAVDHAVHRIQLAAETPTIPSILAVEASFQGVTAAIDGLRGVANTHGLSDAASRYGRVAASWVTNAANDQIALTSTLRRADVDDRADQFAAAVGALAPGVKAFRDAVGNGIA